MFSTVSYEYDDIDGNRGIWLTEYHIEDSDKEDIIDQIMEDYPDGDYPEKTFIKLMDIITEELIDIEVYVDEYISVET